MRTSRFIIIAFTLLPVLLFSQGKFDLGLFLGYAEHGGDVHSWGRHGAMLTENAHFAYGLRAKYKANENLGIRLNYWGSKISGQDINIDNEYASGHARRNYTFESNLSELSLSLEYDILGHKRWNTEKLDVSDSTLDSEEKTGMKYFKKQISPYIFGGFGLSFTDPTVNFNSEMNTRISTDMANTEKTYIQLPIGVGLRFDVSENVYMGLEASSRIPLSDYLDGISEAANPDRNDSYQFIGATLGYRFGKMEDRDGDGISDSMDGCPDVPGPKLHRGCPDTDNDGILDHNDSCPQLAGLEKLGGCPDRDGDGIIDPEDKCPDVAGITEFMGCVDTDGDGISDDKDKCPTEVGVKKNDGCPDKDSDADGVPNELDDCPNEAGTLKGCPDSDKDGLADKDDACPTVGGNLNGCPDTDGDGLADNLDNCPNRAGDAANNGCPKADPPKRSSSDIINAFFIDDIYFNLNQANQDADYYSRIDEIKIFAQTYPEAYFTITGHTDNQDSEEYNIRLSERRANKVFDSLREVGIAEHRMSISAMGESQPKATNDTAEGRALNRRVEVRARTR